MFGERVSGSDKGVFEEVFGGSVWWKCLVEVTADKTFNHTMTVNTHMHSTI